MYHRYCCLPRGVIYRLFIAEDKRKKQSSSLCYPEAERTMSVSVEMGLNLKQFCKFSNSDGKSYHSFD